MEKIKLKDGTTFDIVSGSEEYVNIVLKIASDSVDAVVSCFTDENLAHCEILAETEEGTEPVVRASFSDKHMKSFAVDVVDGGYSIVITLEDVVADADEILNILLGGE